MTALLILNYDVVDEPALMAYRDLASSVILGDSGAVWSSVGDTVSLPEAVPAGTHTVVIAYPTRREALARYQSPEYQNLLVARLQATSPRSAFIVDLSEAARTAADEA